MNTVDLITEEGGFDYVSDSYADDLPYWHHHAGHDQLVVPYTLDCNDMRFATPQGFNSGDQFFTYLKDTFDMLYAEGKAGSPKIMNIGCIAGWQVVPDGQLPLQDFWIMRLPMKKSGLHGASKLQNTGRRHTPW